MALHEQGMVVMRGWLNKPPSRKLKWNMGKLLPSKMNRRFVVLRTAFERSGVCSIMYYEQEEIAASDHNLRGSLLIHGLTVLARKSKTKFVLQSNEKEIVFVADSREEADTWCNEIEKVIHRSAGGLAGAAMVVNGIDYGQSRGVQRGVQTIIHLKTRLGNIPQSCIVRKGWLLKSSLQLTDSSSHQFAHGEVRTKSRRLFFLTKTTVNELQVYNFLYFKTDAPRSRPKRVFQFSTHSSIVQYRDMLRVQIERGVGLYVTAIGASSGNRNVPERAEREEQIHWFQDLRAAALAIKVARMASSSHLLRSLTLNRQSGLQLSNSSSLSSNSSSSMYSPSVSSSSMASSSGVSSSVASFATSSHVSLVQHGYADVQQRPIPVGEHVVTGTVSRSMNSHNEACGHPVTAQTRDRSQAPAPAQQGFSGNTAVNLAPLLLIENYERISDFVGGDAGAFYQVFLLNSYCAMYCDTVIERFIQKSSKVSNQLSAPGTNPLTIDSMTREVRKRFGPARASAHAVTIQVFVHHHFYCEAQQRMQIELQRHAQKKASSNSLSDSNVNSKTPMRRKSLKSYNAFATKRAESPIQQARQQAVLAAAKSASAIVRPPPRRVDHNGLDSIINEFESRQIDAALPPRLQGGTWTLKFATCRHGYSLKNLYEKVADTKDPLLIVVLDADDVSFGTFCTAQQLQPRSEFVGTGESFIFKCCPHFEVFRWTQKNECFALAEESCIAFGSGGGFGLWMDVDLEFGVSQQCSTFDNTPLSSDESFETVHVEVWALK